MSIDGYATEFCHRVATKGGAVGAYLKENVTYRRRFDTEKTQPDLEHLWLELPGRNKHSKLLLGVIYRSDLLMTASYWLESFEDLLSHITSTWDGMVVLTGDINFDLIGRPDSLVTRYSNTLDMFRLKQIVTKPTRVTRTSQTLIDHITPFAVHYEKMRNHVCETAINSAKIHSLVRKYEHLRIN